MALSPIPVGVSIVDKGGTITDFFRLRWQELIDRFVVAPTVATLTRLVQTAAIVTTAVFTTRTSALYRVSWYLRKTIADGVSSSLQITIGWVDEGAALSQAGAVLATDTVFAQQNGSLVIRADATTDITAAVAYASNTPNQMRYDAIVTVEQLGS